MPFPLEQVPRIVPLLQTVPLDRSVLAHTSKSQAYYDDRNTHQSQELATFLVVLLRYPHLSPREPVNILHRAYPQLALFAT